MYNISYECCGKDIVKRIPSDEIIFDDIFLFNEDGSVQIKEPYFLASIEIKSSIEDDILKIVDKCNSKLEKCKDHYTIAPITYLLECDKTTICYDNVNEWTKCYMRTLIVQKFALYICFVLLF